MCPRSGSGLRRSFFVPSFRLLRSVVPFFVPSFRFWGSREHPPKPPFWKSPHLQTPDTWKPKNFSAVPKRGRSKCGRTQEHANERKREQMSTKERKRKSAIAQKSSKGRKERKRGLLRKLCKQPGLEQLGNIILRAKGTTDLVG